ncbi:hypothetical protein RWE15_23695 [Virgibacillus halophilus]|uniref:Shikimate dehydrogenase n=1 Tax=Tigheibacillus halophilus TaxID=361280 RepID=A0ABU5CD31_9BACI|nr:hypothetical protein [Virgibacillus halophilus]
MQGGAARGIYAAMLQTGMPVIDIANRTRASAEKLSQLNSGNTSSAVLSLEDAEASINKYDLIIQTTSVGMEPDDEGQLVKLGKLRTNTIVSDIVYKPIMTKLLKQAEQRGARIHQGHLMLLHQARYAFEIWTECKVDVQSMDIELKAVLEGR